MNIDKLSNEEIVALIREKNLIKDKEFPNILSNGPSPVDQSTQNQKIYFGNYSNKDVKTIYVHHCFPFPLHWVWSRCKETFE